MKTRTIEVGAIARVEGEGALTVRYKGDHVEEVELRIFEPPRFFEALLRGRSPMDAPDVTARICGICPVAYQMSSCRAIEDAYGIDVEPSIVALRRLLYCGEWIESHVLHMVMLHAPDFLGVPDVVTMAQAHGEQVRAALRLKKAGNTIMRVLGGREIHPVNVRIGGFWRAPAKHELAEMLPELRWAQGAALDLLRWVATFPFPDLARDYLFVALRYDGEYAIERGRIASSDGLDVAPRDFDAHFRETHVKRSNALHAHLHDRAYLCGPLARMHLGFDRLPEDVRRAAAEVGFAPPCKNPYRSILARGLEVLFAVGEAIRIIEGYAPPARPYVELPPARAAVGHGATEAPRGMLHHRYRMADDGRIADARIVPPTSQNQATMEDDLRAIAPRLVTMPHAQAAAEAERAIRNHDPCISCATHFLDLRLEAIA